MGKHKNHSPKEYKKQRQVSNGISNKSKKASFEDGLPCVYMCFMCQSLTNYPKTYISKRNRDISYFVCSDVCYRGIGEHF